MATSGNNINRRQFLRITSGSAATTLLAQIGLNRGPAAAAGLSNTAGQNAPRPNILWVSTEDISPDLCCYGDNYAVTPNIDKLAGQGVRYTNAYSHSGVCAPTRSGIITGMYPTTLGTHNMRCKGVPPAYVKCFGEYLRVAGYYCTNNSKTDYQFDPPPSAGTRAAVRLTGATAAKTSRSSPSSISRLRTKARFATEVNQCCSAWRAWRRTRSTTPPGRSCHLTIPIPRRSARTGRSITILLR